MTDKLYYSDQYQREWTAEVLDIQKAADGFQIKLSATCFYPEGGGQPGDRGTIGRAELINTVKDGNEEIIHICKSDPEKGSVQCSLDWDYRHDYMQQHTGQHILSAVLKHEIDINTVSVHQGEAYTAVETDRAEITDEEIEILNRKANDIILQNMEIKTFFIDSANLAKYPLRRPTERTGKIRIVELGDYDRVACGGVHTARTGEVRMIHVYAVEKMRDRCRILAKIGDRILGDYKQKTDLCRFFSNALSAPEEKLIEKWETDREGLAKIKGRAVDLERNLADVLLSLAAREKTGSSDFYSYCYRDQDAAVMKELVKKLMAGDNNFFFIGNRKDGKLQWQAGSSPDVKLPFDQIREKLFAAVDGKGGGKAPLWQGFGSNSGGFDAAVRIIREGLKKD